MKRTAVRHSSSLYPCRSRMSWSRRKLRSALKNPSTLNQASRADVASRKKSVTTNNKKQRQSLGRSKTDRVERSRSTIRRRQTRTRRSSSSSSGSSGCSSSTELRTDKKRRRSQMLRRPTKSGKFDNTSNGRSRSTIPKVSARRRKRSSSQLKSPDDEGQDKSWFSRSGTIKAVKKYAKHVPDSRGSSSASSDSSYSDSSRSPSPRNKRRRCKPSATTASKARFTTHKRRSRPKSKSRKN
ncbi:micronuclear linker histone polyprotein-like [Periplaneta americana]|uniref:micronuclear linker histone polyprotein-like n=1 Tax=Periplaneta americana TaxID=6978 RepID=UPI0037E853AB